MSSDKLVLFDLPSKDPCAAWSLNPWKTRLALNFKGIDYKTEWTEYPDIRLKIKPNVPSNESGVAHTIPTVRFPDGTWMMDSAKIAPVLEKLQPQPSLHLDSPYLSRVTAVFGDIFSRIRPNFYAKIPVNLLNDVALDFWYTTRRERLGMSVEEFEAKHGGEPSYAAAEPFLQQMTALLKENGGPFFLGKEASYADFVWVSGLVFMKRIDNAILNEVLRRTGDASVHEALLDACAPWLKRNDH